MTEKLQLGSGLIGIGRKWGAKKTSIPTESQIIGFLNTAVTLGVVFFDTAPAYGSSEARLGSWLSQLDKTQREKLTIATKFGEHWIDDKHNTKVDHSFEALKSSLEVSIKKLKKINVLQIHKATAKNLESNNVAQAIDYAKSLGIKSFGASVNSVEVGKIAINSGLYSFLQFPLNVENQELLELVSLCISANITPIINRPVNMGHLLTKKSKSLALKEAFDYLTKNVPQGIILTGTKNAEHLKENMKIFKKSNS